MGTKDNPEMDGIHSEQGSQGETDSTTNEDNIVTQLGLATVHWFAYGFAKTSDFASQYVDLFSYWFALGSIIWLSKTITTPIWSMVKYIL